MSQRSADTVAAGEPAEQVPHPHELGEFGEGRWCCSGSAAGARIGVMVAPLRMASASRVLGSAPRPSSSAGAGGRAWRRPPRRADRWRRRWRFGRRSPGSRHGTWVSRRRRGSRVIRSGRSGCRCHRRSRRRHPSGAHRRCAGRRRTARRALRRPAVASPRRPGPAAAPTPTRCRHRHHRADDEVAAPHGGLGAPVRVRIKPGDFHLHGGAQLVFGQPLPMGGALGDGGIDVARLRSACTSRVPQVIADTSRLLSAPLTYSAATWGRCSRSASAMRGYPEARRDPIPITAATSAAAESHGSNAHRARSSSSSTRR